MPVEPPIPKFFIRPNPSRPTLSSRRSLNGMPKPSRLICPSRADDNKFSGRRYRAVRPVPAKLPIPKFFGSPRPSRPTRLSRAASRRSLNFSESRDRPSRAADPSILEPKPFRPTLSLPSHASHCEDKFHQRRALGDARRNLYSRERALISS